MKLNRRIRQRSQRYKEKEEITKKTLAEKQEEEKERAREERVRELEKIKEKRRREKEELFQATEVTKSYNSSTPLYKQLEINFEQKMLMPELERKKAVLRTIRNMHKPLDYDGIRTHARQYSQRREEIIEKGKKELEEKIKEQEQNYTFGKQKSSFLENVIQSEKDKKESELMKSIEKQDLQDKMKNYGMLVQQMHKPVISRKKQVEVELNIAKLNYKPRISALLQSQSEHNRLSLGESRDSVHELNGKRSMSPVYSEGQSEYKAYFSGNKNLKPLPNWGENSLAPPYKLKKNLKITDWLLQKRLKRLDGDEKEDTISRISKKPLEWTGLVEKMQQREKIDYLLSQAKGLEEKAKMREESSKLISDNLEKNQEHDEMLFSALKARLAALENI